MRAARRAMLLGLAVATLLVGFLLTRILLRHGAVHWPGESPRWPRAAPEAAGFSTSELRALRGNLARRGTVAFLLLRRGRLVQESYAMGRGPWRRQRTASLTKSLAGSLALLVLANDRRLAFDDPASKYVPAWRGDPVRSRITLRQLMTHSAGVPSGTEPGKPPWAVSFWTEREDLFERILHEAPIVSRPGTRYEYSGPGYAVVSYALTACLRDTPTPDIRSLLQTRIMGPLGIPRRAWSLGPPGPFEVDGMRIYPAWTGGSFTPPAIARIGELMLRGGRWKGRQLIDSSLVAETLRYAGTPLPEGSAGTSPPLPALGWVSNSGGALASLPRDAFLGTIGGGGQILLVIPSLDIVFVRIGAGYKDDDFWLHVERELFQPLMRSAGVRPGRAETPTRAGPAQARRVPEPAPRSRNVQPSGLDARTGARPAAR